MTQTTPPTAREAVARIVDPDAWNAVDYFRRFGDTALAEKCAAPSLAKADRILALNLPASAEVREAIRNEIVNTPETADFMAGVPLEAAHQRERWGVEHDGGKTAFDWLIGYLAQKAVSAQIAGDAEKALHHTISTAAALANWHAQIVGRTNMRPGIGPDNGGDKEGSAHQLAAALDEVAK